MAFRRLFGLWAISASTFGLVAAHGGGHQKPLEVDPNAPWATRHMAGRSPYYESYGLRRC